MEEPWRILLYRTPQGESPVKEFIDNLELKAQTKVYNTINLLRDFGIRVGTITYKKAYRNRLVGTAYFRRR